MKYLVYLLLTGILVSSCDSPENKINTQEAKKPNILLVVVDDMGYTDSQPYGGEISTPNIAKLAEKGVIFTDFHTSISCSPTRSMLLSGTDNHLAGLGTMAEIITPNQKGKPGYEGYLNNNVVSLAEVLQGGDYHTYMAGKWHLGDEVDNIPGARGFEKSFGLLSGGGSHYPDMSGLMAFDQKIKYAKNGAILNELPEDFYSSRSYADFLINAIKEGHDDKPFLGYLAFSAPHDPLHVPEPWRSKYRGKYDEGYTVLRAKRIENSKKIGLVSKDAKAPTMNKVVTPWESLSEEERKYESRKMEVYAGMVENLDFHLGRVLNFLTDIDELDNTIIVFLSDNGANPWNSVDYPGNSDGVYLSKFNNDIDNIGKPNSNVAYGPGWASAGSGPLDYFKLTVGEGGIRTPLIISGPGIEKGKTKESFAYVTDIMPTLLDMVGVEKPVSFKGEKVESMSGKSLMKVLSGESKATYGESEFVAGEMANGKWVRRGNYKAQFMTAPYGNNQWELFDLSADPGETTNIASKQPEILSTLKKAWISYSQEVGIIPSEN